MKTHVFCFDGTWNGRSDDNLTNILKIYRALRRERQTAFYFEGPGEDTSSFLERFLGGGLGVGCQNIRDRALDAFNAVYQSGDKVCVFGFSRGAAISKSKSNGLFCFFL